MYQLNPAKGLFETPDGEDVPTSTENLFRYAFDTKSGVVGGWYMTQFFKDAQPGDPILVRVGGPEQAGIVAIGTVHRVAQEDGDWKVWFKPDRAASEALRANPISYARSREIIPKSQSNLVRLEPHWKKVEAELKKRAAEPVPLSTFETLQTLDEEGNARFAKHLQYERRASNRRAVLARAPIPYRCEACGFSFAEAYGADYAQYIQVHHLRPVSKGPYVPKPEDFALLCANCHAVAHWKRATSPLSIEELRATLNAPASEVDPLSWTLSDATGV